MDIMYGTIEMHMLHNALPVRSKESESDIKEHLN